MLIYMYIYIPTGTRSFKQSLNFLVWSYCYLEHARKAPPFYPAEFDVAATAILAELNITHQDITVDMAKSIYLYLCELME